MRIDYNAEEVGVDEDQIGEFAYDYVEVRRDFLDWGTPTVAKEDEDKAQSISEPTDNDVSEGAVYEGVTTSSQGSVQGAHVNEKQD